MMCVHLRKMRTNYNKMQVKDEDVVIWKINFLKFAHPKKRERLTNGNVVPKKQHGMFKNYDTLAIQLVLSCKSF